MMPTASYCKVTYHGVIIRYNPDRGTFSLIGGQTCLRHHENSNKKSSLNWRSIPAACGRQFCEVDFDTSFRQMTFQLTRLFLGWKKVA